jgi:hypothetical protein
MVEVTYICALTGTTTISSEGLPRGWVIPSRDISQDVDKPIPECYTVIAFSSEKACKEMMESRLKDSMMTLS